MRAYRHELAYRVGASGICLVFAVLTLGADTSGPAGPAYVIGQITPPRSYVLQTLPPEIEPTASPTTEAALPEQPPNQQPPQYKPPPPAPVSTRPPATTPQEAVAAAVDAGRSRGVRVGVAVLDLQTGAFYGGGDVGGQFASASVMKVFIATRLLVDGLADDPTVRSQMWQMIVASNDDAARTLYRLVGTESLIPWIAARYGIGGLAPANIANYWGLTRITARAVVRFYAAVADDPAVAPWLLDAMANATATAADGFYQFFGIPSTASNWRVKQGWMCCLESLTRMHSTGYIDHDRYAVAMLIEGSTSVYGNYGAQTLTLMARALLPAGSIPQPASTPPTPTETPPPSPTPTPSPSPSPSEPTEPSPSPTAPPE
jgi:hypothetical protein